MASTSARSSRSFTVTGVPPAASDVDAVDQEAVLGEDRLVAGAEIGLREQAEKLVGAVAADDVGRVEPVRRADRLRASGVAWPSG